MLAQRATLLDREALTEAEFDLSVRQQELNELKAEIAASELQIADEWNQYGISATAYLGALKSALIERGKPDREAVELLGNLWELDTLLEDRILTLSTAVDSAKVLVELLTEELEKVTQQIANASSTADLADLETKQAQLKSNLELATLNHRALEAQLQALVQKRNFAAVLNQGVKASEQLIDAFFKSPDPDSDALKSQLLQIQAAIAEADRLAKEAEERSKQHELSLNKWEETHLALQDEVLQRAERQRKLISSLVSEVERKYTKLSEAIEVNTELNGTLERIFELLEKAGDAGNRQADLLREYGFQNRLFVISEVLATDYKDLSENEKKELKELAAYYDQKAKEHERLLTPLEEAIDEARYAFLISQAAVNPEILIRNPYREKFNGVQEKMYDALEVEPEDRPRSPVKPADFYQQAAWLPFYFDWIEDEIEDRRILKKAIQKRRYDINNPQKLGSLLKTSKIIELALKERWQELSNEGSTDLSETEYIERNLSRYEKEFKDEHVLTTQFGLIDQRLNEVNQEINESLPADMQAAEEYQNWIYGYEDEKGKWVNGQLQITESEKERMQAELGLSDEDVANNRGLQYQANERQDYLNDLLEEIDQASENIDALQREANLVSTIRDGLEKNLEFVEQFRVGMLSWQFIYTGLAQLPKRLAEENRDDFEISRADWLEREAAAIERQRLETVVAIADIQQQEAEYDWQTALNGARSELNLAELDLVISPDQTKLAELREQLAVFENQTINFSDELTPDEISAILAEVDLPEDLKDLMTDVEGQLTSALQGEIAGDLSDRLFDMINRFSTQVAEYQEVISELDEEIFADSKYIDDLYKTGHDLKLINVDDVADIPEIGHNVVIVAKVGEGYHIRIFDRDTDSEDEDSKVGGKVFDSTFAPNPELAEEIDNALNGQDFKEAELLSKITDRIGYTNRSIEMLTTELNGLANDSEELQRAIQAQSAEVSAAWERVITATEDVILAKREAQHLRDWIEKVIEQRIKERKARRRARWFKAFGIIAMIISAIATIATLGGASALFVGIAAASAAAINGVIAGMQGDWLGLVSSIVQVGVSIVGGIAGAASKLISQATAKTVKTLGGAAKAALKSARALSSEKNLLGFLEAVSSFAQISSAALDQAVKQASSGISNNLQKMLGGTFDVFKDVPVATYKSVEAFKSEDFISGISAAFGAAMNLGKGIYEFIPEAAESELDLLREKDQSTWDIVVDEAKEISDTVKEPIKLSIKTYRTIKGFVDYAEDLELFSGKELLKIWEEDINEILFPKPESEQQEKKVLEEQPISS